MKHFAGTSRVLAKPSSLTTMNIGHRVEPGDQREFRYWSADWKYRNDADLVAVRAGCTLTAWTEVAFEGEKMILVGGSRDRWVVLAESQDFANFHENILSFQCRC